MFLLRINNTCLQFFIITSITIEFLCPWLIASIFLSFERKHRKNFLTFISYLSTLIQLHRLLWKTHRGVTQWWVLCPANTGHVFYPSLQWESGGGGSERKREQGWFWGYVDVKIDKLQAACPSKFTYYGLCGKDHWNICCLDFILYEIGQLMIL